MLHNVHAVLQATGMVDSQGFRPNVGIVITNPQGQLLWARRVGNHDAWQFPQGGIQHNESPEQAMYRELHEEVGLLPQHVRVLGCTRDWLHYRLPNKFVRPHENPVCIGQKQKWFLLEMLAADEAVSLVHSDEPPEFNYWRWVSYWYPTNKVVSFKREVYRRALRELSAPHLRYMHKQSMHKQTR